MVLFIEFFFFTVQKDKRPRQFNSVVFYGFIDSKNSNTANALNF